MKGYNEGSLNVVTIMVYYWLKQLDSKLSPVKGFMGSNPLSMIFLCCLENNISNLTTPVIVTLRPIIITLRPINAKYNMISVLPIFILHR